jgi:hypothetical protein
MSAQYLTDPWRHLGDGSGGIQQAGQSSSSSASPLVQSLAYPLAYGQYSTLGAYQPSYSAQQYGASLGQSVAGLGQSYPSAFQSAVAESSASPSQEQQQQQQVQQVTAPTQRQRQNGNSHQVRAGWQQANGVP